MSELTVRFWGVRGSLATPGVETARYGGNTSCIQVTAGDEQIVFDMGTGLRELGTVLGARTGPRVTFFLSHYHWDHIQGLPFFGPAFNDPTAVLSVYGATREGTGVREILAGQMMNPYFPVGLREMKATLLFHEVKGGDRVQVGPAVVTAREMNHPGGSLAFRIDTGHASVVYSGDFEHGSPLDDELIDFARGADLLIFDSTYTEQEYQRHEGFGHSTWAQGTRIAKAAEVKRLVLFHHDPSHSDERLDEIVGEARVRFSATDAAQEGRVYSLPARAAARRSLAVQTKRLTRRRAASAKRRT